MWLPYGIVQALHEALCGTMCLAMSYGSLSAGAVSCTYHHYSGHFTSAVIPVSIWFPCCRMQCCFYSSCVDLTGLLTISNTECDRCRYWYPYLLVISKYLSVNLQFVIVTNTPDCVVDDLEPWHTHAVPWNNSLHTCTV